MRTGYLECFSGLSGDMMLGALVDAGVPPGSLAETAEALNVGARLEVRKVSRGGIAATRVEVITPHTTPSGGHGHAPADGSHAHGGHGPGHAHDHAHDHEHSHEHTHEHSHEHTHEHSHEHAPTPGRDHGAAGAAAGREGDAHAEHRSLRTILGIIASASLTEAVRRRASRAFTLLGEAEAAIHSIPVERVHFHEVGAVDTIVDIVCAAAGAEMLADRWLCSPLNVGSGTVDCAHGTLPVPAPATLALLGSAPLYAAGPPMERLTPTGAAILRMLEVEYGPLPAMRVRASGYGAGGREIPGQPNVVRLLVGEETPAQEAGVQQIAVIETVIDDSTPQLVSWVSELLLAAGAWDVYRIPVQMKKGRTGIELRVLARPDLVPALRELILRETTTIGLHWRIESKMALERELVEAETEWGTVHVKVARWPSGEVTNASPEFEDCRRIAESRGVPLKQVMQAAVEAWRAGRLRRETAR